MRYFFVVSLLFVRTDTKDRLNENAKASVVLLLVRSYFLPDIASVAVVEICLLSFISKVPLKGNIEYIFRFIKDIKEYFFICVFVFGIFFHLSASIYISFVMKIILYFTNMDSYLFANNC